MTNNSMKRGNANLLKDDYTELIDYFNLFDQLCGATDFDQFAYEYFQEKGLIK